MKKKKPILLVILLLCGGYTIAYCQLSQNRSLTEKERLLYQKWRMVYDNSHDRSRATEVSKSYRGWILRSDRTIAEFSDSTETHETAMTWRLNDATNIFMLEGQFTTREYKIRELTENSLVLKFTGTFSDSAEIKYVAVKKYN